jgi:hypothetical protein
MNPKAWGSDFQGIGAIRQALKIRSQLCVYFTTADAGAWAAGEIFFLLSLDALCFLVTAAGLAASVVAAVALGAGAGVGEAAKTLTAMKPVIRVARTFFM